MRFFTIFVICCISIMKVFAGEYTIQLLAATQQETIDDMYKSASAYDITLKSHISSKGYKILTYGDYVSPANAARDLRMIRKIASDAFISTIENSQDEASLSSVLPKSEQPKEQTQDEVNETSTRFVNITDDVVRLLKTDTTSQEKTSIPPIFLLTSKLCTLDYDCNVTIDTKKPVEAPHIAGCAKVIINYDCKQ
ncbi:MAG: hypothetical protein P8Y43_02830 [Sulfurovaceae bacterium]